MFQGDNIKGQRRVVGEEGDRFGGRNEDGSEGEETVVEMEGGFVEGEGIEGRHERREDVTHSYFQIKRTHADSADLPIARSR